MSITTAATFPGNATAVNAPGGSLNWSNPTYILADDISYTTAAKFNTGTVYTHFVVGYNFGFAIPADATILGIHAEIMRRCSNNTSTRNAKDEKVGLFYNGGAVGSNGAYTGTRWPTSLTQSFYGSPSSMWSYAWTPAIINHGTFGIGLAAEVKSSFLATTTAYVDYIKLDITYEEAPAFDGILKRYNGAAWEQSSIQNYNGAAWETKALKYFDGADWLEVDNTG